MMLILLSASCTTTRKTEIYVPDLDFPHFPGLEGARAVTSTETAVPNAWLFALAEYKIKIMETQYFYEKVKERAENDTESD